MSKVDEEEIMIHVVNKSDLPYGTIAHKFEGYRHGDVDVSFFLVDSPPVKVRCCTSTPTRRSS